MPPRKPSAACRLRRVTLPLLALMLTACANKPPTLPAAPAPVERPASVSVSESASSQDWSARAQAWLKRASALLADLTPD